MNIIRSPGMHIELLGCAMFEVVQEFHTHQRYLQNLQQKKPDSKCHLKKYH